MGSMSRRPKGTPFSTSWDDLSVSSVLENRETCYTPDRILKSPGSAVHTGTGGGEEG